MQSVFRTTENNDDENIESEPNGKVPGRKTKCQMLKGTIEVRETAESGDNSFVTTGNPFHVKVAM